MKKSIFTFVFMALMSYVTAQTLQFELDGNVYYDGEAVECTNDEYGYGEYIQHMQLRNLTSEPVNVLVEMEFVEPLDGVMNTFCWGMCFGPGVMVSPTALEIGANSLNTDELSFHALYPEDVFGDDIIRYYAYTEDNPSQRISIIVKFHKSGEGVAEMPHQIAMGQAYPNPATTTVNFDYSGEGVLSAVVYNLMGQEVMRQELNANNGQLSLSVADLQEGIYFCTMMVNGRATTTQKFVVKK